MQNSLSRKSVFNTPFRVFYALVIMASMVGASGSYAPSSRPRPVDDSKVTDTWAVKVQPGTDASLLAQELGAENLGQVGTLADTYLFRLSGSAENTAVSRASFSNNSQITWFEQQVERQQSQRAFTPPTDPLYATQWHLNNTGTGVDANVLPAWTDGYTGSGVTIAIVDDGVQSSHPDLTTQYDSTASWDFNGNDNDASPNLAQNFHGTSAAGIAAANNDGASCGVGVAYDAGLSSLRLIAGPTTDAMEAAALTYAGNTNAIYSNSWGPLDDSFRLEGPGALTLAALQNGVETGRDGKGSIYVWAAGNGLLNSDNVNYDGYANSRFTIAVGAVDEQGNQTSYSEAGAAMLVTAPSGDGNAAGLADITTTDLSGANGYNTASGTAGNCVNNFGSSADSSMRGTSSSAPVVAGVAALMLQANPNLGWRDVQAILARSAAKNDPTDPDWTVNGAGLHINHKYGFGLVDAGAAVAMAKTWTNLGTLATFSSGTIGVNKSIPDNTPGGVTSNYVFNQNLTLERVEVVLNVTHTFRGDLKVVLTSPSGTQSVLADWHDDDGDNYAAWKFTTVRDLGEAANGTWSLNVTDTRGSSFGNFDSWQLNFYGTVPAGTNDDTGTSEIIASIPYQSIEDTLTATSAVNDPAVPACNLNKGTNSVWYSYTPSTAKPVHFDTYGSTYDTFIAVWTMTGETFNPVICNNDSASTLQSAVGFTPTAFTTYYIEVAQNNGPFAAPPAADSAPGVASAASGGILRFHGTTFSDARGNYWAWSFIEGLANAGITSGCGSGAYCPATPVSRAQMAVFLVRATHGASFIPPTATGIFLDVPVGSFGADYIEQLSLDGITSGCGNGNFCPSTPVSRAQMAIFLLRGEHGSSYAPPAATGTRFTDVTSGSFGAAFIEQLATEGITGGCTATTYCPGTPVTRAQMAVFLDRAFSILPLP